MNRQLIQVVVLLVLVAAVSLIFLCGVAGASQYPDGPKLVYLDDQYNITMICFGVHGNTEVKLTTNGDWCTPQWLNNDALLAVSGGGPHGNLWMLELNGDKTQLTRSGWVAKFTIVPGTNMVVFSRWSGLPGAEYATVKLWKMQIGKPATLVKSAGERPSVNWLTATPESVYWIESFGDFNDENTNSPMRIVGLSLKDGSKRIIYQTKQKPRYQAIDGLCRSWEAGKLLVIRAEYRSEWPEDPSDLQEECLLSIDEKSGAVSKIRTISVRGTWFYDVGITPGPKPGTLFLSHPLDKSRQIFLLEAKQGGLCLFLCVGEAPSYNRFYE